MLIIKPTAGLKYVRFILTFSGALLLGVWWFVTHDGLSGILAGLFLLLSFADIVILFLWRKRKTEFTNTNIILTSGTKIIRTYPVSQVVTLVYSESFLSGYKLSLTMRDGFKYTVGRYLESETLEQVKELKALRDVLIKERERKKSILDWLSWLPF